MEPQQQQVTDIKDTPVRINTVQPAAAESAVKLDPARLSVIQDLGISIPLISVHDFLKFLAPPQPDFNVNLTMESLKQDPNVMLPSGRWSAFDKDPAAYQRGKYEDNIFRAMTGIFNKVVEAILATSRLPNTIAIEFLHKPNTPPPSSSVPNATRPDGYLALKDRPVNEVVPWADIVLSCEYKRTEKERDLYDDVRKCIWSMHHIMRDDPCRRATFGMTIENVNTRLWFCCRSAVIVSEPFNFISEPKLLVKLFAAFAFADKKSLGYDPTMERAPGMPTHFNITVHTNHGERRFRTKKLISLSGAAPLRGRGTRVFEAIEIDDEGCEKGSNVVLKDLWVDKDRAREGFILAELYKEANDEDKALVRKHFLSTICHGDVRLSPEVVDDTEDSIMRGWKTTGATFSLQYLLMDSMSISSTRPESLRAINILDYRNPTIYAHKAHYRIVFKEQGTTIDRIPWFHNVLKTLEDTVDALRLLRRLGWVHRDVSIGNILSYDGGTKLVDLEYAKKVQGNLTRHDHRTGTLHFIPIEAATHKYIFHPTKPNRGRVGFTDAYAASQSQGAQPRLPWTYNHLHDVESLWWVAVWMVCNNCFGESSVPPSAPQEPGVSSSASQELPDPIPESIRADLFPLSLQGLRRRDYFMDDFGDLTALIPTQYQTPFSALNLCRQRLIEHYQDVESDFPGSINLDRSGDDIYTYFRDALAFLKRCTPNHALIPIRRLPALNSEREGVLDRPSKRRRMSEN